MKAKLRENAPWETQKLKTGIILNKKEFTTIKDETVQSFIRNSLSKTVEIEGETPVVIKRKLKVEEPVKVVKKRVLKTTKNKIEKKATKVKTIVDEETLTEEGLKKLLKSDILELLLKREFSKKELKGLKKDRLIEVYLIDKL